MTDKTKVRLYLHSETGTEGGHWATQNHEFITPPDLDRKVNKHCQRCGRWWANAETTPEPKPSFTYYRPEWSEDGKNYSGGYFGSDVPIPDGQTKFGDEDDGSFNDEWTKRGNAQSQECYDKGHDWDWEAPHESWNYEGLRYLRDGDKLEVLSKDDGESVVREYTVKLISNYDQYREGAMTARGMIIHNYPDPETIDFEQWNEYFFGEYDALLTPAS